MLLAKIQALRILDECISQCTVAIYAGNEPTNRQTAISLEGFINLFTCAVGIRKNKDKGKT